jgi:hypothetical protein
MGKPREVWIKGAYVVSPFCDGPTLFIEKSAYDALKEENAKLKAENWVLRDSRLRTYDGLAQKADKYETLIEALKALTNS